MYCFNLSSIEEYKIHIEEAMYEIEDMSYSPASFEQIEDRKFELDILECELLDLLHIFN
jgi:hypothetical protein